MAWPTYLVVLMLPGVVAGFCDGFAQIDGGGSSDPARRAPVDCGGPPPGCSLLMIGPPAGIAGPSGSTGAAAAGAAGATGGATGAGGAICAGAIGRFNGGGGSGSGSGAAVHPGVPPQW